MTDQDIYISTDAYHAMLDRLEAIARNFDPNALDDLRTRLVMAVSDEGSIWPMSCLAGQSNGPVIVVARDV